MGSHSPVRRAAFLCGVLLPALLLGCVAGQAPAEPPEPTLRVASYNIRHGQGTDGQVDLQRTADVLRRMSADVVALQEVDEAVRRSGGVRQAERLGELLGMHHAFGAFMDYGGGRYGLGLLSRRPIGPVASVRLTEGNEPRVALAAEIDQPDGTTLTVVVVHFDWVRADDFRFAQAQEVASYLDALPAPYVVLGDFNDQPGSRTIDLFRQRALEATKPPEDRFTFPAGAPDREIDFIFAAPAAAWTVDSVAVIDEAVASDHRPVFAVLRYLAGAARAPTLPLLPPGARARSGR
jgi:endonuclease/exonuclease/phosphatase family metal-dependent hydrolase